MTTLTQSLRSDRLGTILTRRGDITDEQLSTALRTQGAEGKLLGAILLKKGAVAAKQLGAALSEQYQVPYLDLVPEAVNPQIVRLLPEDFAREREVAPVALKGGVLLLAMAAPDDIETISETELLTGYRVEPVVALESAVQVVLDRGHDERIVARQTVVDLKFSELAEAATRGETETVVAVEEEQAAPVVRLVRAILMGAINARASDIHLEPNKPEMRVRYRVDGELQQVMTIPKHIEEAVVARIKVMGDMDTTESRRAQDGRLSVEENGQKVNFRVSVIPTVGGEKVVMRLLDEGNKVFSLDRIGLTPRDRKRLELLIDKPHGMMVVTGPTGSGKSTTLYAVLTTLNQVKRNIVTVEDPVEYRLPGINQVASDNEFGLGFANALKYIMRQDPDVIMVGEIRDHETAQTSVQAALTGHLLISTLHTNDAVGAVARLNDLGIDPFKIGGSLLGAIAQRLLRTICPECKEPTAPSEALLQSLSEGLKQPVPRDAVFFQGRGCRKCLNTGYAGRMPVFEIMSVTPQLADAIERGLPASRLREIAIADGMVELRGAGLEAALAGKTTVEEVYYKTNS